MGVYRANYGMADPLRWGNNSGCGLLENKCFTNGRTDYPDMFCNPDVAAHPRLCTYDRLSLGRCEHSSESEPLPPEFQYFDDPTLGSAESMDHCPYVTEIEESGCTDGNTETIPGSFIGPSSRCVKGEGLRFDNREIGDVCVNTQCSGGRLRVQFLGDGRWHDCNEGEILAPSGGEWRGSIRCPKYADVCTAFLNVSDFSIPAVAPLLGEEPNHWDTADTNDESGGTNHDPGA
ncbi:leishmanolysin, partial [Trypanosoma rangeli SC58]